MQISEILNGTQPGDAVGTRNFESSSLGEQDFFTLLTAQLRAQNPLEPVSDQQFLSELAQFSSLEQLSSVNDNLAGLAFQQEQLALFGALSQSASLIGHQVEYVDPETLETSRGEVQAVRLESGGLTVDLGDRTVPLQNVTGVIDAPDAEEEV